MEKIVFALLVLCAVLFIGEVFMKEAYADYDTPGATTWTITMTPGSGPGSCSGSGPGPGSGSGPGSGPGSNGDNGRNSNNTPQSWFGNGLDDPPYGSSVSRDASGNSLSSGKYNFNLSLSDLLSLVGKTITDGSRPAYDASGASVALAQQQLPLYQQLPVIPQVPNPARFPDYNSAVLNGLGPSVGQEATHAIYQGSDYIKYKNAINMDDYVRKDSIPCYACTL